jgi:hypothetical protein
MILLAVAASCNTSPHRCNTCDKFLTRGLWSQTTNPGWAPVSQELLCAAAIASPLCCVKTFLRIRLNIEGFRFGHKYTPLQSTKYQSSAPVKLKRTDLWRTILPRNSDWDITCFKLLDHPRSYSRSLGKTWCTLDAAGASVCSPL